jgi:hypothetical protein
MRTVTAPAIRWARASTSAHWPGVTPPTSQPPTSASSWAPSWTPGNGAPCATPPRHRQHPHKHARVSTRGSCLTVSQRRPAAQAVADDQVKPHQASSTSTRATSYARILAGFASPIVARLRCRRWRDRALSVGAVGVAARTVAGLIAVSDPARPSGGGTQAPACSAPGLKLTAAQRAICQLSLAATESPRPSGRYVALTEKRTSEQQPPLPSTDFTQPRFSTIFLPRTHSAAPLERPKSLHNATFTIILRYSRTELPKLTVRVRFPSPAPCITWPVGFFDSLFGQLPGFLA